MLGAVQAERPAAHEPREQEDREKDARGQLVPLRQGEERERHHERREEEQPLPAACDAAAADERRDGRGELEQSPHERRPGRDPAAPRHGALVQLALDRRERPVALADDHDAVRARHAAEAGQRRSGVGACEYLLNGLWGGQAPRVHQKRPSDKCRTA